MLNFKKWLMKEGFGTGCKLGLYPSLDDALGQYPPLYGTPKSADLITYMYIQYGLKGPSGKDGFVHYHDEDPRIRSSKKVRGK